MYIYKPPQLDEEETVPRFSLSYVDMDLIRTRVREWSSQMKEFFNNHNKGYILLDYDKNGRNVRTISCCILFYMAWAPKKGFGQVW